MSKCIHCNETYSNDVIRMHVARCPKNPDSPWYDEGEKALNKMTKAELKEIAVGLELEIPKKITNGDLVKMIEAKQAEIEETGEGETDDE